MRLSSLLILLGTFASAALLSLIVASFSADLIEDTSERSVERALNVQGLDWSEVHAEGLQVFIAGIAPTEADRFKAISIAGGVVDAARVIDNMQVEAVAAIDAPRFSVEILRSESGISIIGLIPAVSDRTKLIDRVLKEADGVPVEDFLETAMFDPPEGWSESLRFGVSALAQLDRAKISISAGEVAVRAMAASIEERQKTEAALLRRAPPEVKISLSILAPRPVITPFTLRFLIDENGARFDACSADSDEARMLILTAAVKAGADRGAACTIGLGVPSPNWASAAVTAIEGVHELGGGSITFSDADIQLVALMGTAQADFDRIVGEIEAALPEAFALHATLPIPPEGPSTDIPEFVATLSPEGQVQLRGRLQTEMSRQLTTSYAVARFGSEAVHMAARLDETLPQSWTVRVTAGLDALSRLHNGVLNVTPEMLSISGRTGDPKAGADISGLLAEKLTSIDQFEINVTYVEALDPIAALPKPEDCAAEIAAILEAQKISFEPGSGNLDPSAKPIIDAIAEVVRECPDLRMEIQGHTDSQGREEMNLALSQTRAQSVLNALADRRILTGGFLAQGYGEANPIADNETEEGREANRRIEFVLIDTSGDAEEGAEQEASSSEPSEETPESTGETDAATGDEPVINLSEEDYIQPTTQPKIDPLDIEDTPADEAQADDTN